jgi:hypothetical protein
VSQASAAPLAFVRRHRRAHRSPQQRSDRFTGLYTVGLYAAIGAWIGFQALRQSPARGGSSVWLTGGGLARAGTVVLLLGLLAALRYATWQGPVVFSASDVHFLLGAGVGAALGLGAFVLLEAALIGPAALGVLAAALGWLVESSPATARVVLRASPLVLAVVAAAGGHPGGAGAASRHPHRPGCQPVHGRPARRGAAAAPGRSGAARRAAATAAPAAPLARRTLA